MENTLYSYTYLPEEDILLFNLKVSKVEKDTAAAIYDTYLGEKNLPEFSDFIMDASKVTHISDPAIGILMKSLSIMKKAKGYLVMVMTEDFLQKIMLEHPEMFNVMAVFHNIEDAKAFIKRSKK
ncbi:MAG: hypothetical protein JW807_06530 [Spirochaetes bacterium]|nr:hypothetical protein [Spirochaetota bacterium]